MEPVYGTVVAAVKSMFALYGWKMVIEGNEHIPTTGPGVIASNHIGYLDFMFVGYGAQPIGRLVRFGAKKEVFDHPVAGPLMRGMKHLPVDRDGDVNAIMEESHRRLQLGQLVGMFPEGTISRSFMPDEGKSGAARMAMRAGVPLIPCALWGTHRLWTKGRPRSFTRGVEVRIGYDAPIAYQPDDDPREVTARLMASISAMLERQQAAYSQQPADESDRWWLPAHLGGAAPTPEEAREIARQERIERRKRKQQDARDADGAAGDAGDARDAAAGPAEDPA